MPSLLTRYITAFIMCLLFTVDVSAQKENYTWHFGWFLGLNFNTTPPTPVYNSKMQSFESAASVSDGGGRLLFYTDGKTVWNKINAVMINGTGLITHSSATQGALIVKKPGSNTLYYIFTSDCNLISTKGIYYSVVDVSRNSGFGEVIQKNVPLLKTKGSEKLTAVKDKAECGFWIITHGGDDQNFYSYHLTSSGIDTQAVVSKIGYDYSNDIYSSTGYLKANSDGTKLAAVMGGPKRLELYDFDPIMGVVSNCITIDSTDGMYGVSFSPNHKLLYVTSNDNPGRIIQYDISSGVAQTIAATKYEVSASPCSFIGAILKGPDHKLYITGICPTGNDSYISVINNPDNYGPSCNFDATGLLVSSVSAYKNYLSLPNNIENDEPFIPVPSLGPDFSYCADKSFTIGPDSATKGSFFWNTADTSKFITKTKPGTYWLRTTRDCITYFDQHFDTILVRAVNDTLPLNLGNDTLLCTSPYKLSVKNNTGVSYLWSNGTINTSVTTDSSAVVSLRTTSVCGTKNDTVKITIITDTIPAVSLGKDTALCANSYLLKTDSLAQKQAHYLWSTGDTGTKITPTVSGLYWVQVSNPCHTKGDTIKLQLYKDSVPAFSLGKDTLICGSGYGLTIPSVAGAKYIWSTGDTTPSLAVYTAGTYWVKASTFCNTKADTVALSFYQDTTLLYIGNDTLVCGSVLKLTASTIPLGKYLWSTGDTTATITITDNDVYWARVTTPCSIKTDSVSVQLVKALLPPADIGNDTAVCAKQFKLGANYSGPGIKLLWSTGDTVDIITVTQTGTYWLEANNLCSVAGDSIFVELVQDSISSISLGNDTLACSGSFDLDAGFVPKASYLWSTGETTQKINVSSGGLYKASLTTYVCNNTYSDSVKVEFFVPKPLVLQDDTLFCEHRFKGITIDGGKGYTHYLWNDGSTQPTVFANADGLYQLTVTDTCGNNFTDEVMVNVCDCRMYVPTAFTPNGDGLNDAFEVTSYCGMVPYQIIIYNRWGEVVFETKDANVGWDGTYNGAPAPEGVYGVNIRFGFAGTPRTGDYMWNTTLFR